MAAAITEHRADIVHLASPFVLGVRGMAAAARLGIPAVAVYQTDLAGYARTYVQRGRGRRLAPHPLRARRRRPHPRPVQRRPARPGGARRAPGAGCGRAAWTPPASGPNCRDEALRRELAPNGELIVGYVGPARPREAGRTPRRRLRACRASGSSSSATGPAEPSLRRRCPARSSWAAAPATNSPGSSPRLDVFVHTGPFETFCQTVQEAMASGVPVVAPAAGGPLDLVAPRAHRAPRPAARRRPPYGTPCGRLAADPGLRAAYGAAARAMVEGRTWAAVGDQLIGHYADVLAGRSGGGGMSGQPLRIVRLANFVAPASGGLRTALRELGKGYQAAGHEPVLDRARRARERPRDRAGAGDHPARAAAARHRRLPRPHRQAARWPGSWRTLAPDRLEVSDRTTLRWTGEWARRARVPAVMVSHETADGVLRTWGLPEGAARRAADALNVRTAHTLRAGRVHHGVRRAGVRADRRAQCRTGPAGRRPGGAAPRRCATPGLRARHAREDEVLLVMCSRLSVEKRPGTALDALEALRAARAAGGARGGRGRAAAGRGSNSGRASARLPVTFLGHVADRGLLGALQASADVCLAPGPAETFGLAALEAMACGTPVVASASSALPEVIGSAGAAAADNGEAFADAVDAARPPRGASAREAARARAECFGWGTAVEAFLAAHDAEVRRGRPVRRPRRPWPWNGPGRASYETPAVRGPRRLAHRRRGRPRGRRVARLGRAARRRARASRRAVEFTNLAVSGAQTRDVLETAAARRAGRCGRTSSPSSSASTTPCAAPSTSTPWPPGSTRCTRPSPSRARSCSRPVCPTPARCSGCPGRWRGRWHGGSGP